MFPLWCVSTFQQICQTHHLDREACQVVNLQVLTRLSAWENFIEFWCHESLKTYSSKIHHSWFHTTQWFDLYHPVAPLPHSDTPLFLPHVCTTGLHLGSLLSTACLSTRTCPLPVPLLPIGSGYFRAKLFPVSIPHLSHPIYSSCLHRLWRWKRPNVTKYQHIKFRREGITQMKEYKIHNVMTTKPLSTSTDRFREVRLQICTLKYWHRLETKKNVLWDFFILNLPYKWST